MKGFRQLRLADRLKIDKLYRAHIPITDIARQIGCHRNTIHNELKRGRYVHLNSDWTQEVRYSPDIAQEKCDENLKVRGTALKIGKDIEFANYLESKVVDDGYSPEAVIGELKTKGNPYHTSICTTTFYNYISKGIFLRLTNKDLPIKGKRRRRYHKVKRQARASAGTSIDLRDKDILNREEFGHWEMDSVVGRRGSRKALLVLTERKTRQEIIFRVNDHTAEEVVRHIDLLEKKWGDLFPQLFKTITVDNGSEFAFSDRIENGANGKRTSVYYCHAYCSCERGSNEKNNQMIRRKFPKGTSFDNISEAEVQAAEDWVNQYPRQIFGYHSAQERFAQEVQRLVNNSA